MVDAPQSARSPQSSQSPRPPRQGSAERRTRESDISVAINLDGTGVCEVATGLPFFDHMLNAFAAHGAFDLRVQAKGDVEIDAHHTVEDLSLIHISEPTRPY